jgi:hypothetical protein
MDNFGSNNQDVQNLNEPDPLGSDTGGTTVSHTPLNLGGGGTTQAPKISPAKPVISKPAQQTAPPAPSDPSTSLRAGRITGVKTFFTKLHPGALEFLDEQITKWLSENPSITIRLTNTTTGEIQGKKTEPSIIITVWY